jgi:hypothetical protein
MSRQVLLSSRQWRSAVFGPVYAIVGTMVAVILLAANSQPTGELISNQFDVAWHIRSDRTETRTVSAWFELHLTFSSGRGILQTESIAR